MAQDGSKRLLWVIEGRGEGGRKGDQTTQAGGPGSVGKAELREGGRESRHGEYTALVRPTPASASKPEYRPEASRCNPCCAVLLALLAVALVAAAALAWFLTGHDCQLLRDRGFHLPPSLQPHSGGSAEHGKSDRAGRGRQATTSTTSVAPAWIDGIQVCADREACLRAVDGFLERQPRGPLGLFEIHSGDLGGGPCGKLCRLPPPAGRCDTYDNSVAAIYLARRGRLREAQRILDAFIRLLYPSSALGIKPEVLYDGLPSGRKLTLLAAAYSAKGRAHAGDYLGEAVSDGAVDTGNNAWAALAFAHYAVAANATCYALVAHDILQALQAGAKCEDSLGGFLGRLPPYEGGYRSVEHNIDVVALARTLGSTDIQRHAQLFVRAMYGRNTYYPSSYSMGTGEESRCNTAQPSAPVPADGTYWNLLADADPDKERITAALKFALRSSELDADAGQGLWAQDEDIIWAGGAHPKLNGTRFTTWGHGVQWENTASAAMAMAHYRQRYGDGGGMQLSRRIAEIRDSLRLLLAMYGGVPGSVLGGNIGAYLSNDHDSPYPGGSDTGIKWTYLRYLHVAATAWTGLFFLFQAGDSWPVQRNANPYARLTVMAPPASNDHCLPPRSDDDSVGQCCAGGRPTLNCCPDSCCPTADGVLLGCCGGEQPAAADPAAPGPTTGAGRCCPAGVPQRLDCCPDRCCPTRDHVFLGCCQ